MSHDESIPQENFENENYLPDQLAEKSEDVNENILPTGQAGLSLTTKNN